MPELTPRLPERPSLEQLQKQSKDLLRQLRAGDSTAAQRLRAVSPQADLQQATLADAQFAIAREHGFETWARLKHHLETLARPGFQPFEQLAQDLADAYSTGDAAAIREINWARGTSFIHDRVAERMQRRLPTWFAATERTAALALADARHLVARAYDFETWADLAERATHGKRTPAARPKASPPPYTIDPRENTIHPGPILADEDWDAVLDAIEEHRITGLHAGGHFTDRVARRLARLAHLTRLNTDGSVQLTDDGLLALATLTNLEELDLSGWRGQLTDRGLAVLRHLPALRRFQMCWQQHVSDAGIAHLSFCHHLERVNLLGTPTGDGALHAMAGKGKLTHLKTGRLVTDAGLPLLHEIPVYASWQGGQPQYNLMSFESEPNHLLLEGSFTDQGLSALATLHGLFGLNFSGHCTFSAAGLAHLAGLPNLAFLGCDGDRCNDEAMRHISRIPRLRMLMAQGTVATDDGFEALAQSPALEYLWGRECPNLTSRGFAALASMPSVKGLAVSCLHVDDQALSLLPDAPHLHEFMAMDVPDRGFRHIGRCENLESLWCMYCRDTGDEATGHLAPLRNLKHYYAGSTRITDRSLEILSRLASLETLNLWQCPGLTNAGMAHLASLPHLRELTLQGLAGVTRAVTAMFPDRVRVNYST